MATAMPETAAPRTWGAASPRSALPRFLPNGPRRSRALRVNHRGGDMHVYGTRDLQRLLGIGPSSVRSFISAGHGRTRKGSRGRLQFTFQDLIILRTARTLSGANVPTRRLNRCLRELRKALPDDVPLSGLSITAIGDQVAVREGRQHWDTESRQYLLALDVSVESGEGQLIAREEVAEDGGSHYERAYELEDNDPEAAIAAYQLCIGADGDHLEARINCGR